MYVWCCQQAGRLAFSRKGSIKWYCIVLYCNTLARQLWHLLTYLIVFNDCGYIVSRFYRCWLLETETSWSQWKVGNMTDLLRVEGWIRGIELFPPLHELPLQPWKGLSFVFLSIWSTSDFSPPQTPPPRPPLYVPPPHPHGASETPGVDSKQNNCSVIIFISKWKKSCRILLRIIFKLIGNYC